MAQKTFTTKQLINQKDEWDYLMEAATDLIELLEDLELNEEQAQILHERKKP